MIIQEKNAFKTIMRRDLLSSNDNITPLLKAKWTMREGLIFERILFINDINEVKK